MTKPKHLSIEARKLWSKIADQVTLDAPAELLLLLLCEAYDRRSEARVAIAKDGAVFADRFGQQKPSPWVAIRARLDAGNPAELEVIGL